MSFPLLAIRVLGRPATQGSKDPFIIRPRGGKPRAIVVESGTSTLRPWREAIRATAVDALAYTRLGPWQPTTAPVRVELAFVLPKPSSAPKRRRTWPVGARSGDLDKLTRAVLDALTDAGVWRDDAQVVHLVATKDYDHDGDTTPGVHITVHDDTTND